MDWWWYPLIAFAGLALAATVWLFLTRDSALVEMPGGETIYAPPPPMRAVNGNPVERQLGLLKAAFERE